MMAVQTCRREAWNLVLLLFLCTPHHGHTLVTDNRIITHIQHTNSTGRVYEITTPGISEHIP